MMDVHWLRKWVEMIEEYLFKEKIDYTRDSREKKKDTLLL
jgi:phage anti-repressor protein